MIKIKPIILVVILAIYLSGCAEIRYAKANAIRSRTRRTNELHDQRQAEAKALAPDRLATKVMLIWTGGAGGVVVILALAGSVSYYIIALALAKARQAEFQLIPMDRVTRQYPLIIYRENRAYIPNTGERLLLDKPSPPHQQLTAGSQAVQLRGVADPAVTKIIEPM